ncbi:protein of unknown function [Modestobacter italicus]|uniref:Uncharacterized protein n=1 Tax=Modestobacter italicus (strain DSM 44449 / CECT 9708 / BC 501) TaxID=2732864 RepID=I4F0G0_MODI5|nr:protein of unknown function [Modestobacter marinus]
MSSAVPSRLVIHPDFWLHLWLQFDPISGSFAVVRRIGKPPAHQPFPDSGGHRGTSSARPGSAGDGRR